MTGEHEALTYGDEAVRKPADAVLEDRVTGAGILVAQAPQAVLAAPGVGAGGGGSQPKKAVAVDAKSLESKFKVKIEKGNKEWSASDLNDLSWALSRLTKAELAALKGYRFLRWDTPEGRNRVEPSSPAKTGDCGFQEADFQNGTFKISMFDACFVGTFFSRAEHAKIQAGTDAKTLQGTPAGGVETLHEIGHAMQVAEWRKAWEEHNAAWRAHNQAVDAFNQADEEAQKTMEKKVDSLEATEAKKRAALDTAKDRALKEFMEFRNGKDPLTEHPDNSPVEQFAEAFKIFKWNPNEIKSSDPKLATWLAAGGFLRPVKKSGK